MNAAWWQPLDDKYLTEVDMRCESCGGLYVIHTASPGAPNTLIITLREGCSCGSCAGRVVGVTASDEWPEFIDA